MGELGIMITPMNLPFANADNTDEGDDGPPLAEVSHILVMTDPGARPERTLSITSSSVW